MLYGLRDPLANEPLRKDGSPISARPTYLYSGPLWLPFADATLTLPLKLLGTGRAAESALLGKDSSVMQRIVRQVAMVFAVMATGCAAQAQSRMMRYPDVHKKRVVFTYEGDLWLGSTDGGLARRITTDPGSETWAKFSPDGSQLAFTAEYDGGVDVYVMPAEGGVPQRLTYHPAGDRVLGWFADGKHVLFRSRREYSRRAERVYKVAVDGGMPVKLNVDRAGLTALSPDGTKIAYNRISREDRTWKRHKGGTAQDIWMGSLAGGDYRKITTWEGSDNFPMWQGHAIYFNSDRAAGTLNLHKYDVNSGEITALTHYTDYDVKYPSIGPGAIIYQYAEAMYLLDLKSGRSKALSIGIASDHVRMRPEFVDVEPRTGSFGLSPSGTRVLLEARGEILNLPAEDGESINLTDTTDTREKNASWSPDGRWIAFISDRTGEEEIYLVDQTGEKPWRQLTKGGMGFRLQHKWSPDSKWLIFSDKFLKLNLVNADSGDMSVVDQSEFDDGWYRWGIQDYAWSPDSKWIAYSKLEESGNEAIFLYSMDARTSHRVTDEIHSDYSPTFDPNGKYLYFLSHRHLDPIMGMIDQNHIFLDVCQPYVVLLEAGKPSPFAPKDSKEEPQEDEDEKDDDNGDSKDDEDDEKDKKSDVKETHIDLEGIGRRILAADGVSPGNYFRLEATDKGFLYLQNDEYEFLKYQTVTDGTGGELDLYHYNLEDAEAEKVLGGIANYHLSADGEKLIYRAGRKYGVVDVGEEADVGDGEVDLDNVYIRVDRHAEFLQIFNEAWRVQRDFFYDPNMHGVDWVATGEKYRKLVPHCANRADLGYLIGEMIAELNIGHTYSFGGDIADNSKSVPTGYLGVEFTVEKGSDYYRISHIIPGTSWVDSERSPLDEPGCPIKEGDYLIAIDGREVTTDDNVFKYLQNKRNAVVTLLYNDKPSRDGAKRHRVKTIRSEGAIRYREWVDNNRAFVEKVSGGTIGYLHIPNMGRSGLVEFARYWFPLHYKHGFIIDERYNGGGFTSQMI
ncbi:MAG: PD40 domain-containing protein, partial [Planctomycetes bacterium]|nr:PD40 domain-containing protein [Planctomycetota bacterium]